MKLISKDLAQLTAKKNALRSHLQALPGSPNPESLSRSYDLPLAEVLAVIRSTKNAR